MPRQAHNYTHKDTVWVVEDRSLITIKDDIIKSSLGFDIENEKLPYWIRDKRVFNSTFRIIKNGFCTYKGTKYKVHIDKNLVSYIILT